MKRRHVRTAIAAAVVGPLVLAVPAGWADSIRLLGADVSTGGGCPAPPVDPPTRLGEIATANTYLRSLVTHDTSELRVSRDVLRTEEGGVTANGAQQLCQGNQGPVTVEDAVVGIRELRWPVVDGDQAIAFYLLDSPTSPTYIAERFQVDGGLIHRIEAIFYIDTAGYAAGPESLASRPDGVTERIFDSDDGPAGFFAPADHQGDVSEPAPAPRGAVHDAALAYLHALVSHDASHLPLAPTATRIENQRPRGDSAAAIRRAIAAPTNKITGVHDVHVYVEGDEVIAMYRMDTTAVDPVTVTGSAVWAATRLQVGGRGIEAIESICSSSQFCGASA